MKSLFTVLFCVVSFLHVSCQADYTSFLEEENLELRSEIGANLIDSYRVNDLDSLKIISVDLLELGRRHNNDYCLANGFFGYGIYSVLNGNVSAGEISLKKALRYFKRKEDWSKVSQIFKDLGNGCLVKGEFYNAIEFFKTSIDFGEHSNDPTDSFNGEVGLAECYLSIGDTVKGYSFLLSFKKKALSYNKFEAASNAASRLSTVELDSGNLDESMAYLEESIFLGSKLKSKLLESNALTNKAILLFSLGEEDSSLVYFIKALEMKKELKRPKLVSEAYFNLSSFFIFTGDANKAKEMINSSISISKKNGLVIEEFDAQELLLHIYNEGNNKEDALEVEGRLAELKEVLLSKKEIDQELHSYVDSIKFDGKLKKGGNSSKGTFIWLLLLIPLIFLLIKVRISKR